jgi:hypothetical protein
MALLSQEIAENTVATVVDFVSIMFAYNLGVYQLEVSFGLAYAFFDAYIVIWQRKRFTNWIRRFSSAFQAGKGGIELDGRKVEQQTPPVR